jgi:hypothetical protein
VYSPTRNDAASVGGLFIFVAFKQWTTSPLRSDLGFRYTHPLDDSVYARFKLPIVVQYDITAPYRPEALRTHKRLAAYYKNIPEPKRQNWFVEYIKSFFLAV